MIRKILSSALVLLALYSSVALSSPLIKQWQGTGAEANYYFCEYGDGEVKKIWANENCPLSN
ncbi:TPA: hypothetical protein ACMDU7_000543 [Vibrio parahaemolyticus]|nr:hypothetical protein [Vibrio parahaemolyticus]